MTGETETPPPTTLRRLYRIASFGLSAGAGFLVAEAVIVLGLYAIFGRLEIPGEMSSSPTLVALDVFALVIGVVTSFTLNERTTVRREVRDRGWTEVLGRLARFEGVSALGNVVIIVVQLALLAEISLSPAIGSIIGAIVGFPFSYLMSMRLVWRVRARP